MLETEKRGFCVRFKAYRMKIGMRNCGIDTFGLLRCACIWHHPYTLGRNHTSDI